MFIKYVQRYDWVCQQCVFSLNSFGSVMKTTMTIKIQGKGGEGATFQRYLRPGHENLEYILDHIVLQRFDNCIPVVIYLSKIFEVTYHENCIRVGIYFADWSSLRACMKALWQLQQKHICKSNPLMPLTFENGKGWSEMSKLEFWENWQDHTKVTASASELINLGPSKDIIKIYSTIWSWLTDLFLWWQNPLFFCTLKAVLVSLWLS